MKPGLDCSTYVGETARQFGRRVQEHMEKLNKLDKESFMVEHWMLKHGTSPVPPKFQFKILNVHKEALSRQLDEAVHIRHMGVLNRRGEFAANELIRLQTRNYSWVQKR